MRLQPKPLISKRMENPTETYMLLLTLLYKTQNNPFLLDILGLYIFVFSEIDFSVEKC